ncbi:hypothetical protein [Streptomyces stelliscabiei]|uniref:hypothetical protein n=1 Tax=Streptomyces stelliscabiei TaxID=146820 RepID=UPI0029BAB7B2|nr:hypothetical protein [Streptomyces stelliscabiei]MDX2556335.1 hypothetical protein [Streptomyces stelliscabiei]MDX2614669.1 hypothetical protein [Streptomyces stelliscabiei]MDX2639903.1 hypothetical protein [Streptomyces stelliscabiei]MDX2662817.1 hypothetical protein [Streptomyces stelliscabiei]MDX2714483.1 hypothetical protein [Streptomyces stelliscabiei]
MEWRTFWQRVILFVMLAALVVGLIVAGTDPNLALAIAAALVVLLKDMWLPGGSKRSAIERPTGVPEEFSDSNQGHGSETAS